jgi:uncharacterized protein
VHQDGLVHISQLADRFVKDPREVVSAGDHVSVRVIEVKLDKQQIALSMKSGAAVARGQSEQSNSSRDDRRGGGRPQAPRAPVPPPQPKRPFNNPFAGLEKLKNS